MNQVKLERLIAFVESHGNKVVASTDSTITALIELNDGNGWYTGQETFPATVKGARDWLGY